MAPLDSLPDEVLKHIMLHVPIKQRLTSCSLVCSRLHTAALAATEELQLAQRYDNDTTIRVSSPEHAQSVLTWLEQYGGHLTSLDMDEFPQPLHCLPCPNLRNLTVYGGRIQLEPTAADGTSGVLRDCTKLTGLALIYPTIIGATSISSLSSLVDLQDLFVSSPFASFAGGVLPRLHLKSCEGPLSGEAAGELSALTSLQELSLTAVDSDVALGPSSVPGLAFPSCIRGLWLYHPIEGGLLHLVPTSLVDLWIEDGVAQEIGALLPGVAQLQGLTMLHWGV